MNETPAERTKDVSTHFYNQTDRFIFFTVFIDARRNRIFWKKNKAVRATLGKLFSFTPFFSLNKKRRKIIFYRIAFRLYLLPSLISEEQDNNNFYYVNIFYCISIRIWMGTTEYNWIFWEQVAHWINQNTFWSLSSLRTSVTINLFLALRFGTFVLLWMHLTISSVILMLSWILFLVYITVTVFGVL